MKPSYALPFFSIFLIIFSVITIIIGVYVSYGNVELQSNQTIFLTCPTNQCAVNLSNGSKRCPTDSTPMEYNPGIEICSERLSCSNKLLPYGLNTDGSVNIDGSCENYACPCVNKPTCGYYILSTFTTSNGNTYEPLSTQRITFPQIGPISTGDGTNTNSTFPILNNINSNFCTIDKAWLSLSQPGCNFASFNEINYTDVLECMNVSSNSSSNPNGFVISPCSLGSLAFITNDSSKITTTSDTDSLLMGCVNASPCTNGGALFYDRKIGGTVCLNLN